MNKKIIPSILFLLFYLNPFAHLFAESKACATQFVQNLQHGYAFDSHSGPSISMAAPKGWRARLDPIQGIDIGLWPVGTEFLESKGKILMMVGQNTLSVEEFQNADIENHRRNGLQIAIIEKKQVDLLGCDPVPAHGQLLSIKATGGNVTAFDTMITFQFSFQEHPYILNAWLTCATAECSETFKPVFLDLITNSLTIFTAYRVNAH